MDEDPHLSLASTTTEWQALSLAISSAEKVTFDALHDQFFARHGSAFMAHLYRMAFDGVLQHLPEVERNTLLDAFTHAMKRAIDEHYATHRSWSS